MFSKESEMTPIAADWLESSGMLVRREFVTPTGICDLVGVALNPEMIEKRRALKQTKTLGSIERAFLLLAIPDVRTRKSIADSELLSRYRESMSEDFICSEIDRLITDRFIIRNARGRLQKRNGWYPIEQKIIAIELKLAKVEEAMRQARNKLDFVDEAYVGLPLDVARRIPDRRERWREYLDVGVGILGLTRRSCEVIVACSCDHRAKDEAVRLYSVEKFLRPCLKGN